MNISQLSKKLDWLLDPQSLESRLNLNIINSRLSWEIYWKLRSQLISKTNEQIEEQLQKTLGENYESK